MMAILRCVRLGSSSNPGELYAADKLSAHREEWAHRARAELREMGESTLRVLSPNHSLLGIPDLQIIGDREDSGNAVGTNARQILIGFIVNHAFEGDVAILHDDPDRLLHTQFIFLQCRELVDRPEQLQPEPVIHW